jgi:hypothetical protein
VNRTPNGWRARCPRARSAGTLAQMLICTTTGRVISAGDRMRALTHEGFTEGELDGVSLEGRVTVRAGGRDHHLHLDDIEFVWRLG